MVYKVREGFRVNGDPEKIGGELERLGTAISPSAVVEVARDESSAMHDCFEWDDDKAAEAYRVDQARYLLRAIVVVMPKDDEPEGTVEVRAYECVEIGKEEKKSYYVPTVNALKDEDLRAQVIGRLTADIESAERTAENYEYLCQQFGEVRRRLKSAREAAKPS